MSVMDSVKLAYELAKKSATIELQEAIMNLREEVVVLQEKNIELTEQNRELKNQQLVTDEMVFENGMYWKETSQGRKGPFCPQCFDANARQIRLQLTDKNMSDQHFRYYSCRTCHNHYDN